MLLYVHSFDLYWLMLVTCMVGISICNVPWACAGSCHLWVLLLHLGGKCLLPICCMALAVLFGSCTVVPFAWCLVCSVATFSVPVPQQQDV